jgi:FtsP/CotA-like multicopper oxidase with cupredoxin domain
VTGLLLTLDPALVALLLIVWGWAGARAAGLPYGATAGVIRRRSATTLALITVGVLLALARVGLVIALGQAGWWFVQEKVVLALPLLLVPAVATVIVSVPRLVRLRRAARVFPEVVAPSLRHEAAHPLVAWPVQATAIGAAAGEVVLFFVAYPATAGSSFAVATAAGLGALACWLRVRRRYQRFAGAVVFPSRRARLARSTSIVVAVAALTVAGPLAALAIAAPAPDAHADAAHTTVDLGGGRMPAHGAVPAVGVDKIRGEHATAPVRSFTLTARHARVTLPGGSTVDALTYNGTLPGPELRVREGDLVEVTLHNADIAEGVTIHWHGYDVPVGEDGVAGVTQDAVPVGGSFTYRFLAKQVGTFWYHSHQNSYQQVWAGLYGLLIVEPVHAGAVDTVDIPVPYHQLSSGPATLLGEDRDVTRTVAAGATVRLRLVNAAESGVRASLLGTSAALVAIDGTDLSGPPPVVNPALRVAAGGRADFAFTMPATPVRLSLAARTLTLIPPGGASAPASGAFTEIDPLRYGTPAATPFGAGSRFDRHFTLVLDQKVARLSGVPAFAYTVNGNAYPEIPAQLVSFGDLVKFTIVARGYEAHPMHPHGHHVLVLSRNGVPVSGSPLWMDTFEVLPGEVWEVAMRADNPGIWMDHCHNLRHAAEGMVFHLVYDGITTPYRMTAPNHPE